MRSVMGQGKKAPITWRPGYYRIRLQTFATETVLKSSAQGVSLSIGDIVKVVKIVNNKAENRIRGQLENDQGWISLMATNTGKVFVESLQQETTQKVDLSTVQRRVSELQVYCADDGCIDRTVFKYASGHWDEAFGPLGHSSAYSVDIERPHYIKQVTSWSKKTSKGDKCCGLQFTLEGDLSTEVFGDISDAETKNTYECLDSSAIIGLRIGGSTTICPAVTGVWFTFADREWNRNSTTRNGLMGRFLNAEDGVVVCRNCKEEQGEGTPVYSCMVSQEDYCCNCMKVEPKPATEIPQSVASSGKPLVAMLITPMNRDTALCKVCGNKSPPFTSVMACGECNEYFCTECYRA